MSDSAVDPEKPTFYQLCCLWDDLEERHRDVVRMLIDFQAGLPGFSEIQALDIIAAQCSTPMDRNRVFTLYVWLQKEVPKRRSRLLSSVNIDSIFLTPDHPRTRRRRAPDSVDGTPSWLKDPTCPFTFGQVLELMSDLKPGQPLPPTVVRSHRLRPGSHIIRFARRLAGFGGPYFILTDDGVVALCGTYLANHFQFHQWIWKTDYYHTNDVCHMMGYPILKFRLDPNTDVTIELSFRVAFESVPPGVQRTRAPYYETCAA